MMELVCRASRQVGRPLSTLILSAIFVGGLALGTPTKAADPTQKGLGVAYTYGDFTDVSQVVDRAMNGNPNPGKPVLSLDQRGNEGKKVLTSNQHKFVGAILSGYVKFPQAGTYQISMRTNDGTRIEIDGKVVLEDGDAHPDRDRGPADVTITKAGWTPIKVYYFQRKGSWILRVNWSGPGLTGIAPIGPEFLAH